MGLNKKQRRFIQINQATMSVDKMAVEIKSSVKDVQIYLAGIKKNNKVQSTDDIGIRKIIRSSWKKILVLAFVAILIYANGMKGDFVSDDYASITQNNEITKLSFLVKNISYSNAGYFMLASLFKTTSPLPYHIFSLLSYIFCLLVAYIFLRIIRLNEVSTFFTMLIFVVLPIHVEAISWISGKPYVLSMIGVLISVSLLILYERTENKKYIWWFLISLPFCYLTEPVRFAAMPLVFFGYVVTLGSWWRKKYNIGKILVVGFSVMVLALIILWPKVMDRINSVNGGYNSSDSVFYNPFEQYPTAVSKYLQLMLVPTDLTLYHTMYVVPVWLNWFVLLMFLTVCGYFLFNNKMLAFALLYIFLAMAPSMAPVKVSWIVAERYAFVGSLGLCLVLGIVLYELYVKNKYISVVLLAIIVSIYSYRVIVRNIDWSTNHNLWVNTVQVSPNSHNAWNNIGDDYDKLKDYPNAVKSFTQSTVIKPNYADAYHNRANIFFKMGRYDLAKESYLTAIKYSPSLMQSYISLIQVSFVEKNAIEADRFTKAFLDVQPNNPQAWYYRAIVLTELRDVVNAKLFANKILAVDPNNKEARELLTRLQSSP